MFSVSLRASSEGLPMWSIWEFSFKGTTKHSHQGTGKTMERAMIPVYEGQRGKENGACLFSVLKSWEDYLYKWFCSIDWVTFFAFLCFYLTWLPVNVSTFVTELWNGISLLGGINHRGLSLQATDLIVFVCVIMTHFHQRHLTKKNTPRVFYRAVYWTLLG